MMARPNNLRSTAEAFLPKILPPARKLRPTDLLWLTLAQVGFSIVGRCLHHPSSTSTNRYISVLVLSAIIEACIYVGLWRGRNWARILIIAGRVLEFLAVPPIGHLVANPKIFSIIHVAFGAYLVYWLTRKPVVAFFKAPGEATSKPAEATDPL